MFNGNMCCGVVNTELMLRVGPDLYEQALQKPHAREMDFTGKPMKGFVYIAEKGFEHDSDLQTWIELALRFVTALPPK